eukprot:1160099-Pelagomonas_calceolata.AAC.9
MEPVQALLAKALGYAQVVLIAFIVLGDKAFEFCGVPTPPWCVQFETIEGVGGCEDWRGFEAETEKIHFYRKKGMQGLGYFGGHLRPCGDPDQVYTKYSQSKARSGNPVCRCFFATRPQWFVGNMIFNGLTQTGAFEVYSNDQLVSEDYTSYKEATMSGFVEWDCE